LYRGFFSLFYGYFDRALCRVQQFFGLAAQGERVLYFFGDCFLHGFARYRNDNIFNIG